MKTNSWQFFGTTVAGPKRVEGDQGQDAHLIHEVSPTQAIITVCDGAGSRSHSAAGAQFCAEQGVAIFLEYCFGKNPSELTIENWSSLAHIGMRELLERLKEHTLQLELPMREFACTVQVLVIDGSRLFHCHVGDGRAAFKIAGEPWQILMTPFQVMNQAGVTCFLTTHGLFTDSKMAEVRCEVVEHEALEGVCLVTDGAEDLVYIVVVADKENKGSFLHVNIPFNQSLDPLLDMIAPENQPEDLSNFWSDYLTKHPQLIKVNDDKTLVVGKRHIMKTIRCSETNKEEK